MAVKNIIGLMKEKVVLLVKEVKAKIILIIKTKVI